MIVKVGEYYINTDAIDYIYELDDVKTGIHLRGRKNPLIIHLPIEDVIDEINYKGDCGIC